MRENLPLRNSYCEFCCIPFLLHRYIGSNVLVNLTSLNVMCCTLHATSTGVIGHVNSFMMCPRIMSTCSLPLFSMGKLCMGINGRHFKLLQYEQLQTVFLLLFLCAHQVLCYEYAISRGECTKKW